MSWKIILKENRLVSQNITHTKVDENKPEQTDDRCKEALKKILRNLEKLCTRGNMEKDGPSFEVRAHWEAADSNKREKTGSPPYFHEVGVGSFDAIIKVIDAEFPEELCCVAVEQFQKLEKAGKAWLKDNGRKSQLNDDFDFSEDNTIRDNMNSRLYADCFASEGEVEGESPFLSLEGEIKISFHLDVPKPHRDFTKNVGFDSDFIHISIVYYVDKIFKQLIQDGFDKTDAHTLAVWSAMEDIVVLLGPGAGMI